MRRFVVLAFASVALIAAALPVHFHKKSGDLDFEYRWPSEAAAIPSLDRLLRAQMNHDLVRYAKMAAADRTERAGQNFPFHAYSFGRRLRFGGQTARLASFADERNAFTGGAHGNPSTIPLLWDKKIGKSVKFANLFERSPASILRAPYCRRLVEQRKKKLGGDGTPGQYWQQCPDPLTLSVIPEDKNRNGRFDGINVTASPYEAGSYAEGYYIVMLPVTPALIAALKPEYRSSFEVYRQ